ncbi:MAG: tetratricopeptide repeat protein [Rhodospirillaceae bacterium]|jgi:tetratricopeptide (TPR) repeat protein|nr:tetratricopeptide repeat protein [Rhodospirillaceae bacterium]MBT7137268.1 tetratricopeptide repeat protein [Rhodospirillaceae bacterium]
MIWLMQSRDTNSLESIISRSRDLARAGEHKQAYKLCRKAVSGGASHPDLYLIYGVCAYGSGKSSEAIKILRKSLRLWPGTKDGLFNLGFILLSCGDAEGAIEPLIRLLDDHPDYPGGQSNLAAAYFSCAQFDLATQACLEAIRLATEDLEKAELYNLLGSIYREDERNEQSGKAFRKALELNPNYVDALANLCLMLEESAQIEAAFKASAEGRERFAGDHRFSLVLAKCERRRGDGREAVERLSAINLEGEADAFKAQVYYEMGRLWDRQDAAREAFDCFTKANDILAETKPADIKKGFYPKILKASSKFYASNDFPSGKADIADGGLIPGFLIGFPRSGTTLLELTLAGHPHVAVMEEPPLIQELYTHITGADIPYPGVLDRLDAQDIAKLRAQYFERSALYTDLADKMVLMNKHPLDTVFLPVIQAVFPDAKIIFSARHPVDVCLSCWMQEFQLNEGNVNFLSLQTTADFYAACMDLWMHFQSEAGMEHVIISYEDVVDNHQETASKAIKFLGLDWSDGVLDHMETAKSMPRVNTASYHQVTEPIYARSKNRWHKYRQNLAPILPKLERYVEHFGYDL